MRGVGAIHRLMKSHRGQPTQNTIAYPLRSWDSPVAALNGTRSHCLASITDVNRAANFKSWIVEPERRRG